MCTSIVYNGNKTIVGFNLDILNMTHKVTADDNGVYINILDAKEGWLPLFGVNNRGDFVAMPTCWPYDPRSEKTDNSAINIINLDIDVLLKKISFEEAINIIKTTPICSVPNLTFQSQITNKAGDVIQLTPGINHQLLLKPKYSIMTNYSPFVDKSTGHPWQGTDRYNIAQSLLSNATADFDVQDCFDVLKATSQTVCPTVVSMVYNATDNIVYWCENREYDNIIKKQLM